MLPLDAGSRGWTSARMPGVARGDAGGPFPFPVPDRGAIPVGPAGASRRGDLQVVLGAGQVGTLLAEALRRRGHRVRLACRCATSGQRDGIETAPADACDPEAVAHLVDGASVAYLCARPGPRELPRQLLAIARGAVEGSARGGASLVVLDDLSAYGATPSIGPDTPVDPRSHPDRMRAEAAAILLQQASRSPRRVVVARAADLFGPGVPASPVLGERFFRRVQAGRPALAPGDPDLLHSYAYAPDVVAGLVALGESPTAEGVHLLPVQPAESTREVIARFHRALGLDPGVVPRPAWTLRLRELLGLPGGERPGRAHRWRHSLVVDDTRTRALLGLAPTPWDEAVAATVAWARVAFTDR